MKKFKAYDNHIELRFDLTKEESVDKFMNLLKFFDLGFETLICTCSYDKDLIDLSIIDGEVNVEIIETKKKFIRTIHFKGTDIVVNSKNTLRKLLKISNDYDAILVFKSRDESNAETVFVVNDNGHDYINFDNQKYDIKEIKTKISQILE